MIVFMELKRLRKKLGVKPCKNLFVFFCYANEYRKVQKQLPQLIYTKGAPKNFVKFTWKHLYRSLFLCKVVFIRLATLLKKRLRRRCFHENFTKFLRVPFLDNTSGRLLLKVLFCRNDANFKFKQKKIRVMFLLLISKTTDNWVRLTTNKFHKNHSCFVNYVQPNGEIKNRRD